MDNISINARSSIRIAGENILYFDPFKVAEEKRDADFVFITHDHYDHYSEEDIDKICIDIYNLVDSYKNKYIDINFFNNEERK